VIYVSVGKTVQHLSEKTQYLAFLFRQFPVSPGTEETLIK